MTLRTVGVILMCCASGQSKGDELSAEDHRKACDFGKKYLGRQVARVTTPDSVAAWQMALFAMAEAGSRLTRGAHTVEVVDPQELTTKHPGFSSASSLLMQLTATSDPDSDVMVWGAACGDPIWRFAETLADGEIGLLVTDEFNATFGTHFLSERVLNELPVFGMVELEVTIDSERPNMVQGCVVKRTSLDQAVTL